MNQGWASVARVAADANPIREHLGEIPRVLNRYAYGLNNPLRLEDPSGHDTMDPNGVKRFIAAHHGQMPTAFYRALIIHEYVHVLQYRRLKAAFLPHDIALGVGDVILRRDPASFGNRQYPLEAPADSVQRTYEKGPNLAPPWNFLPVPWSFTP